MLFNQVCDAKSLNAYDDSFSLFLYTNVNYLYRLGMGEGYLVELMTISTLSFFLFYTRYEAQSSDESPLQIFADLHCVAMVGLAHCWVQKMSRDDEPVNRGVVSTPLRQLPRRVAAAHAAGGPLQRPPVLRG